MEAQKKHDIPLVVVGCDFRSASVEFREQLVTTPEERKAMFMGIRNIEEDAGFAALETCNRTEWIVSAKNPEWVADLLKAQMLQRWKKAFPKVTDFPEPYVHVGRKAVWHLLRVVSGLESLAEGEAQIAGQFQDALRRSRAEKMTSDILNGLANPAGRLAKLGYHLGYRSDQRRGIHGMAADTLADHFKADTANKTVAVLGMGEIGRKTADTVDQLDGCTTVRVNRTVKPEHEGIWKHIEDIESIIQSADALIIATGSKTPVVQPGQLNLESRDKPLLIIDIGIPRQVSPEAQQLDGVDYRCLDDLIDLHHQSNKDKPTIEMEQEIRKEVVLFRRFCIERNVVSLLQETQQRRQEFISEQIPSIVNEQLGELDEKTRKIVEDAMKKLIYDFSSDSFKSIHKALEDSWSNE